MKKVRVVPPPDACAGARIVIEARMRGLADAAGQEEAGAETLENEICLTREFARRREESQRERQARARGQAAAHRECAQMLAQVLAVLAPATAEGGGPALLPEGEGAPAPLRVLPDVPSPSP